MQNLKWKRAKSYPDAPHEYVVYDWDPEFFKELFTEMRRRIATEGVKQKFTLRGKTYTYNYLYHSDGYKYWAFQRILNRTLAVGENARPVAMDSAQPGLEPEPALEGGAAGPTPGRLEELLAHVGPAETEQQRAYRLKKDKWTLHLF